MSATKTKHKYTQAHYDALEASIILWRTDITLFAEEVFQRQLTRKQIEITTAFRDNSRITIRGGAGFGKTFSMAILLWWSLITFDEIQFTVFGPNEAQLKGAFWNEVLSLYSIMPDILQDLFDATATRVQRKHNSANCFAEFRLASKDNPAGARGIHKTNNFIIVDEATGVDTELFTDAFMNIMSDPNPKLCLVSNPDKVNSFFYDTFYDENISRGWVKIHGSMRDGPFMTDEKYEEIAHNYGGVTSTKYRVMALGEFPLSDTDSLIPKEYIDVAVTNKHLQVDPTANCIWGLDPSGKGKDKTVLFERRGNIARIVGVWQGLDTVQLAETVLAEYKRTPVTDRPKHICVDATGLGYGPADALKRFGLPVTHVVVSKKPIRKPNLYFNLRTQLWVEMRDWFVESETLIPDNVDFIRELLEPQYEEFPKFKLEKKEDIKKRLKRSPDYADALAMTFYHSDNSDYDYYGSKPLEYTYSSVYE